MDPVFPNPFTDSFLSCFSLDLCWLKISLDNLNSPNKKITVTAVGLNVRSSLGLIWFVLKCFPACVQGLKASGSLNTSPTCQDQLHTCIWCHCVLPSQTCKTKTDRDTMCFSTSQDVFYFHEWQRDYSISSLCHSLLCQYFDRGCFALFFMLAKVSTPQLRETTLSLSLLCFLLPYLKYRLYNTKDVVVLEGSQLYVYIFYSIFCNIYI